MKGPMRIHYDEEGDYLTIFVGEPRANYGEDISPGITLFKDEVSDEIIGIGVLDFREKAKKLNEIQLNLPFQVDFSMIKV